MKKLTRYGILGRLVQMRNEGMLITFPRYITADGDEADRTMVWVTKINPDQGTVEVLAKKASGIFRYRTMRLDRIRKTPLLITDKHGHCRKRNRYFVANKNFAGRAKLL